MIDGADIENRFGYHPANAETIERHKAIRAAYILIGCIIVDVVPAGREQALALTALQESAMWSNAGIACNLADLALDT